MPDWMRGVRQAVIETLFWIALNIYHEARNQPVAGQEAVGIVTINRARKRRKKVDSIVFQPDQFSWANDGKRPPIKNYDAFKQCLVSALNATTRVTNGDDLNGADHYFNPSLVDPSWAKSMTYIADIGDHRFFRE